MGSFIRNGIGVLGRWAGRKAWPEGEGGNGMFKALWFVVCAVAGALMGGVGVGLWLGWGVMAILGAVGGSFVGLMFARFVPAHEFFLSLFS